MACSHTAVHRSSFIARVPRTWRESNAAGGELVTFVYLHALPSLCMHPYVGRALLSLCTMQPYVGTMYVT